MHRPQGQAEEPRGIQRCRNSGTPVDRVIITEGGSKDPLWNQIKADLIRAETITLKTGGALATNALIGAYAVNDLTNLEEKLSQGLIQTGKCTPSENPLKLPEIPFKI